MSIHDKTPPGQTDFIAFEFELRHPPEKVWKALTKPELLSKWLLPAIEHHLEPGAAFRFQAPPQPGWDGRVDCRYLEIDEPNSISWAWVVGDIDTVVTFTLSPTDSGTLLSLVQSGFKADQKQNFGGARYGWKMMGDRLLELLEGGAT